MRPKFGLLVNVVLISMLKSYGNGAMNILNFTNVKENTAVFGQIGGEINLHVLRIYV